MGTCRHKMLNVPFVLAGGRNLGLHNGRYKHWPLPPLTKHAAMLVTICHLMGQADRTSFGNVDPDTGPLDGLMA